MQTAHEAGRVQQSIQATHLVIRTLLKLDDKQRALQLAKVQTYSAYLACAYSVCKTGTRIEWWWRVS